MLSATPRPPVSLPDDHPPVALGKVGVLLINLGTPEATSYWPMRRYLKEFLSDRRVIEANPIVWAFVLNVIILTTRPSRSGQAYAKIWNRERDESPLKTITRDQAAKVAQRFADNENVVIDWAMRYGLPPIAERLHALKNEGCDRILLFPLYPQYSAATTGTAQDKAFDALKTMRWQPAIRTVPAYHDHPAYIDALARQMEAHLAGLDWTPDKVVASFHGLPLDYLLKGDPYHCQCQKTARLLRERLGWDEERLQVTFQSRFGRAEWLKPYTEDTVAALPGNGVRNLVITTPGFAADCVETLEEIAIGVAETFQRSGGERFSAVPCLNDSDDSVSIMRQIVGEELLGWM